MRDSKECATVGSFVDLIKQNPAFFGSLSNEEAEIALHYWPLWARPNQIAPPGEWFVWLIMSGRGWGKTRTAAEWVWDRVRSGVARSIAIVNDTAFDVRAYNVEGGSGILNVCHPRERPNYEPAKRRITWGNGAIATLYAAEAPEASRGGHFDTIWCDEPAKWRNLRKEDAEGGTTWSNLMYGLRAGDNPRCVCSTTPRPIKWLKDLIKDNGTVITGGSTYENRANLADKYFENVILKQEGTRLGRQEIYAQMLEDVEGALWSLSQIDELRVEQSPPLSRVVVAIDPSVTNTESSDECGIVVAGIDENKKGHILADVSRRCSPDEWARIAVNAYRDFKADRIIGEANNGGDLIELVLRTVDSNIPYSKVHASRGKLTRAEPVAALYEQGKVAHVGTFPQMEDEMTSWVPGEKSPNRMDALVWALTELMIHGPATVRIY